MTTNQLMFAIFSAVIIIFSILTVTSRRILRAATFLLFVLVATGGMYFLLRFNFLAAIQLALYAGGIVVLIIFSILLTSHIADKLEAPGWKKVVPALVAVAFGAVITIATILQYQFPQEVMSGSERTDIHVIAKSLISTEKFGYALPFEVISILLLAAMVGAIILAKKRKD
ncbi:MAG: NADH-quinone oxidoreductase subunit J [Bacteroidales bacterium]|jgi:NADH-quinone oxidoreductase subunit J|nr:NADH-quinone oxidoreductase subunit J [Bacteroidales bacterium]